MARLTEPVKLFRDGLCRFLRLIRACQVLLADTSRWSRWGPSVTAAGCALLQVEVASIFPVTRFQNFMECHFSS